jgi:hypothetical protein
MTQPHLRMRWGSHTAQVPPGPRTREVTLQLIDCCQWCSAHHLEPSSCLPPAECARALYAPSLVAKCCVSDRKFVSRSFASRSTMALPRTRSHTAEPLTPGRRTNVPMCWVTSRCPAHPCSDAPPLPVNYYYIEIILYICLPIRASHKSVP